MIRNGGFARQSAATSIIDLTSASGNHSRSSRSFQRQSAAMPVIDLTSASGSQSGNFLRGSGATPAPLLASASDSQSGHLSAQSGGTSRTRTSSTSGSQSGTKRKRASRSSSRESSSSGNKNQRRGDSSSHASAGPSVSKDSQLRRIPSLNNYVALDCEFVGTGPKGRISAIGRCSIVDAAGNVVLDVFAKPSKPVTDYRTHWSGIRPRNLRDAHGVECATRRIKAAIDGRIVVGHDVDNDFNVLKINHPCSMIRDTAKFVMLRNLAKLPADKIPSLKNLARILLDRPIQTGEHSSVEDSRATMDVFRVVYEDWENERSRVNAAELNCQCERQGEGASNRRQDNEN